MALGFQQTAFQNSAFQGGDGGVIQVPVIPAAGGVGHAKHGPRVPRRHNYWLGEEKPVRLTAQELDDKLEALLADPPPAQAKPKQYQPPAEDRMLARVEPAFVPVRNMLLAQQEYEAVQRLREIVQRWADEEDEREVEMLLLWE